MRFAFLKADLARLPQIRSFFISPFFFSSFSAAIAIFIIFGCFPSPAVAENAAFILNGTHKFIKNDDPAYSLRDYDDSRWQSIKVPGSWQSQGIETPEGFGWYRIHFLMPPGVLYNDPAVLLGRVGDIDEAYLNGVRIGGEGLIAQSFVEATKVQRLYRISSPLLRKEGDNVLAVKVMNTYLHGGIFDKDVLVGDYRFLLIEKFRREGSVIVAEFCFLTFFAISFITCLFFFIKGLRDREYILFWLFISLYGIIFFLGSLTFYGTGLKSPFVQQIINTVSVLLPVNLLFLLMTVYGEKTGVYTKVLFFAYVFIVSMINLFPFFVVKKYFYTPWRILFVITAGLLLSYSIKAYIRKLYEAGPILIGVAGLIAGFILESVGGLDLLKITGFFLWDYSTVFFMTCVMYALASRYMRIRELQSAAIKIFDAHENERKRFARELHDGIGTSLLATKMKLQMLEAQSKSNSALDGKAFPELVAEISHAIEELRAVAMDLRPAFLENTGLIEAMKWHAKKVMERSGMQIFISAEENFNNVGQKVKENFYRIFQEALNNAVKHSGASKVNVALALSGDHLTFKIQDNGKGFPLQDGSEEEGLGLFTIRERVELLGGIIRMRSSDKLGTEIFIEVPVR